MSPPASPPPFLSSWFFLPGNMVTNSATWFLPAIARDNSNPPHLAPSPLPFFLPPLLTCFRQPCDQRHLGALLAERGVHCLPRAQDPGAPLRGAGAAVRQLLLVMLLLLAPLGALPTCLPACVGRTDTARAGAGAGCLLGVMFCGGVVRSPPGPARPADVPAAGLHGLAGAARHSEEGIRRGPQVYSPRA